MRIFHQMRKKVILVLFRLTSELTAKEQGTCNFCYLTLRRCWQVRYCYWQKRGLSKKYNLQFARTSALGSWRNTGVTATAIHVYTGNRPTLWRANVHIDPFTLYSRTKSNPGSQTFSRIQWSEEFSSWCRSSGPASCRNTYRNAVVRINSLPCCGQDFQRSGYNVA